MGRRERERDGEILVKLNRDVKGVCSYGGTKRKHREIMSDKYLILLNKESLHFLSSFAVVEI